MTATATTTTPHAPADEPPSGYSFDDGKPETLSWIAEHVPRDGRVLDVGPGCGTWARKLRDAGHTGPLDCVEIHEPYVEAYGLGELYDTIHIADVAEWEPEPGAHYALAILGDVLEHLSIKPAQAVLAKLRQCAAAVVVSVPWRRPQGPVNGNVHETHQQADLTPESMLSRYPGLRPIYVGPRIGTYYARETAGAEVKAQRLRVAHFAPYAPHLCGLYEAARDMVAADCAAGRDALLVDAGISRDGKREAPRPGLEDARPGYTLRSASYDEAIGSDLYVMHTCAPGEWLARTQTPMIYMIHGRPGDCFYPEYHQDRGGGNAYSMWRDAAAWPRVKACVTMWEAHRAYWEAVIPPDKLRVVDPPPVDLRQYTPLGPRHQWAPDKVGEFNVLICDSWRETLPWDIAHGALWAAPHIPGLRVHWCALETPLGPWEYLMARMRALGILGETCARMPDMPARYRAADVILTPHAIATRIVLEGLACGAPIIAAAPSPWAQWTCAPMDPESVGRALIQAREDLRSGTVTREHVAAQARRQFNPALWAQRLGAIYEEALA